MAFWGVEVKPGKPFTHAHNDWKGRLHISMATLGLGTATAKSTLQCNVGNRSPVYLCSLYPGTTESLQLNLELEEVEQVIFSVIGPRSIHLCGYYLASGRHNNINDDSESYGEDIADTETERSNHSDEDEYEDSFIDDDGDPVVFPSSPISNEEEASDDNRPKGTKSGFRRLRRKYQSVESDDDGSFEEKIIVNDSINDQTKETGNEDSLPISPLYKNKASGRVLDQEMDDSVDRGAGDGSKKNGEDGGNSIIETNLKTDHVLGDSQMHREAELSSHLVDPCSVLDVGVGDIKKLKKKKKGKEKETKSSCNGHFIKLDNVVPDGPKMDKMTQDFLEGNEQYQQHADDKETETKDKILPSSEVGLGQGEKSKKNRKEQSKNVHINEQNKQHTVNEDVKISDNVGLPSAEMSLERSRRKRKNKDQVNKGLHLEGDYGHVEDIIQEYKANRDTIDSNNLIHKFSERKEHHQELTNEKSVEDGAHYFPDGNQSEDRKVKKRKKKSKSQGNVEVVNSDMPLSVEQSRETIEEGGNKREDAKTSQVRTLSNGLVIQELEMGTEDGKIAASGKKISIYYTGKLKENGAIFESNADQAPLKFRLGKGKVMKGWDVGLEGMRVGEKRRLVIPPSMTSSSDEPNAKIPPNSWLVYDIELVKVH
ncbi:peptidyl-prolyl cis-trans isomerase FKBP43-like [Gastrolobium bilobum]|uniref:peptidyl-prolyl cis-trans isomerase FKBP43-like n=1 Tax=Gastrolobium bilobum TaxID=150636 RepID=UPI002AB1016F|nr:peptidyl-prolyl cis-trans isomerase FKBP43-like [Gastrolobium bilobum]